MKNEIYKYMTTIAKNVYINKIPGIVKNNAIILPIRQTYET